MSNNHKMKMWIVILHHYCTLLYGLVISKHSATLSVLTISMPAMFYGLAYKMSLLIQIIYVWEGSAMEVWNFWPGHHLPLEFVLYGNMFHAQ